MSDFEKVSDELRNLPRRSGRWRDPIEPYASLIAGETIFVPLNGTIYSVMQNRLRSAMTTRGYRIETRVHTKDDVPGIVVWATKKETT